MTESSPNLSSIHRTANTVVTRSNLPKKKNLRRVKFAPTMNDERDDFSAEEVKRDIRDFVAVLRRLYAYSQHQRQQQQQQQQQDGDQEGEDSSGEDFDLDELIKSTLKSMANFFFEINSSRPLFIKGQLCMYYDMDEILDSQLAAELIRVRGKLLEDASSARSSGRPYREAFENCWRDVRREDFETPGACTMPGSSIPHVEYPNEDRSDIPRSVGGHHLAADDENQIMGGRYGR